MSVVETWKSVKLTGVDVLSLGGVLCGRCENSGKALPLALSILLRTFFTHTYPLLVPNLSKTSPHR